VLQEILTVKSDDTIGRVKTYEAIVKGENIPDPGVPESFKVLLKELQSLALDIKVLDADKNEIEIKELDDDDMPQTEDKGDELSPGATVDDSGSEGGEDNIDDEFDFESLELDNDFDLDEDFN